jgi:hypothetical protein
MRNLLVVLLCSLFLTSLLSAQNNSSNVNNVNNPKNIPNNNNSNNLIDTTLKIVFPGIEGENIDSYWNQQVSVEELLKAGKIECSDKTYKVTSFNFSQNLNGYTRDIKNNSDSFSPEVIEFLSKNTKPGCKIYFENVMVESPKGEFIKIGSTRIVVK